MLELLKESNVDYNTFIDEITKRVQEVMGKEYTARIYKVLKNNSLELDSLVLQKTGQNFAPNIYLLPYYESYLQGTSLEELSGRLCAIYHNYSVPMIDENFSYSFDEMKGFITFRLINYDRNKKLLEKVPHLRYLDLAITFHCLVHKDKDGIGTIRITNEHMEAWKVNINELKMRSIENTKKRFPSTIRRMDDVIRGMLQDEISNEDKLPDEFMNELYRSPSALEKHKMYILSNQSGINGAASLLYDNVLYHFSEQIQSDFYILPSSIHEVILIPYDNSISREALTEMVKEVNHTQVASDEVLSDRVYLYSREKNAISM